MQSRKVPFFAYSNVSRPPLQATENGLGTLLIPVVFAGAMAFGANLAAVRLQRMTPGRAVLDAVAKGTAAAVIARAGVGPEGFGSVTTLAMLVGMGYAIGAVTTDRDGAFAEGGHP